MVAIAAAFLFAWPEPSGITSTVIKSGDTWQARSLLISHEPFRWLHRELRPALENFDPSVPGQGWQGQAMGRWLRTYYLEAIHHHHDAEENVYNPWLAGMGAEIPTSIASDHRELMAVVDACLGLEKSAAKGDAEAIDSLKGKLHQMMDMLEDHFSEEEEFYPQALRGFNVTQAEEGKIVGRIKEDMGLQGNKVLVPMVVYSMYAWGGPEVVEQFKGNLPAPVRSPLESEWMEDFFRNNLRVLRQLQGRAESEGAKRQSDECSA